jgi:NMD protein affecting ribosome stability and mRNA decay
MEHCVKCGRELATDYEHLSGICRDCMAVDDDYEWEEERQ